MRVKGWTGVAGVSRLLGAQFEFALKGHGFSRAVGPEKLDICGDWNCRNGLSGLLEHLYTSPRAGIAGPRLTSAIDPVEHNA